MATTPRKRSTPDDEEGGDEAPLSPPPCPPPSSPKRLRGGYGGDEPYDESGLAMEDYDDFEDVAPPEPEELEGALGGDEDIAFGDITDAHRRRWSRPAVPDSVRNTAENDLNLQWLDIDMIGGRPLDSNPKAGGRVLGSSTGTVPVIRLYGVNETGNSVAVFIHGFTAYGYFALPRGCTFTNDEDDSGAVRHALEEALSAKLGNQFGGGGGGRGGDDAKQQCVLGVSYVEDKQSIMGYDPSHTRFLKVYVAMPTMIPKLKTIMENGISLQGIRNADGGEVREPVVFHPFECNVPYVLRYMIDKDVTGASWLTLPKGSYRLRENESEKGTHCQVSFKSAGTHVVNRVTKSSSFHKD